MSSKEIGETCLMHFKNNSGEIRTAFDTKEIIEELFDLFSQKYQEDFAILCLSL